MRGAPSGTTAELFRLGALPASARLWLFEVLGQFQSLSLIVGGYARAIKLLRHLGHAFIHETPDDLPVFQHDRRFVAAHLKHAT